jgi:hypothetical protein
MCMGKAVERAEERAAGVHEGQRERERAPATVADDRFALGADDCGVGADRQTSS